MRVGFWLIPVLLAASLSGCAAGPDSGPDRLAAGDGQAARLAALAADIEARGEVATAIALYQRAAALPDAAPEVDLRLGEAYLRSGRPQQAIEAFRAALSKAPGEGRALLGLGSALIETGDVVAGVRALEQGAAQVGTASAYNRLGVAQTLAGQLDAAQASYAQALERDAEDLDIKANLALSLALAGDGPEAVALVEEVASAPGAQPRHQRNLVLVYGLLGRGEEVRGAPPSGLSTQEVTALLGDAASIRAIGDARERARALGTLAG